MTTEANDNRNTIFAEITESLSRLPAETLLPLLPVLGELARDRPRRLTAGMVRRALDRWRLVKLFRSIKTDPKYGNPSNRQALKRVSRLASRDAPGVKCAVRSLERWIENYNRVGADGLAAGFSALLDKYGRPRKRR